MRRAAIRLQDHEAANTLEQLCTINEVPARHGLPALDWMPSSMTGRSRRATNTFDDMDEDTETKGRA
jgi:hypothetical protein